MAALAQLGERKSMFVWYAESPTLIVEFVRQGFGWAELPFTVVAEQIESRGLTRLNYTFQQSDILEGIDVVWTEHQALGAAAHWLRDGFLALPQDVWRGG